MSELIRQKIVVDYGSGFSGTAGYSGYAILGDTKIDMVTGSIYGSGEISGFSIAGGGGGPGTSGFSGRVGQSGFSGYSGLGLSGFSGIPGLGLVERAIQVTYDPASGLPPTSVKLGRLNVESFDPDTDNLLDFTFDLPSDFNIGSDAFLNIVYHMSTSNGGNVKTTLDYDIVNDSQDTTPPVPTGTISTVFTPPSVLEIKAEIDILLASANFSALSQSIRFTLTRNATDPADTHTGAFRIEALNIRYAGRAGWSGISGYSGMGVSGVSGRTGFSGQKGESGYSGHVGLSGFSGGGGGGGPTSLTEAFQRSWFGI